jgi:hypothetical protein
MNLTKADYKDNINFLSPERRWAIINLIKGVSAMLFSSILGTVVLMLVVMTPDPYERINYKLIGVGLVALFFLFIYGVGKLDRVHDFLRKRRIH